MTSFSDRDARTVVSILRDLDTLSDASLAFVDDSIDRTKNFAAGLPLFGVMAAAVWSGEVVAGIILDLIQDSWVMAVQGQGAWLERSSGLLTNIRVGVPPSLTSEMSGMVSWLFFPPPLRRRLQLT